MSVFIRIVLLIFLSQLITASFCCGQLQSSSSTKSLGNSGSQDPFVGTFLDQQLTLILDEKYRGSITIQNQMLPVTAQKTGENQLLGNFSLDSNQFNFTASFENKQLIFRSNGNLFRLQRQQVESKPENKKKAEVSNDNTQSINFRTYNHPSGLTIQCPSDWIAQSKDSVIFLHSPSARSTIDKPTESYIISAWPLSGNISTPDHPQLKQRYLQIANQAGNMKFFGKNYIKGKKGGVAFTWKGSAFTGRQSITKVYSRIQGNVAIVLSLIADEKSFLSRESVIRSIWAKAVYNELPIGEPGSYQTGSYRAGRYEKGSLNDNNSYNDFESESLDTYYTDNFDLDNRDSYPFEQQSDENYVFPNQYNETNYGNNQDENNSFETDQGQSASNQQNIESSGQQENAAKLDPNLIGVWQQYVYNDSGSSSTLSTSVSFSTTIYWTLRQDGSATQTSTTAISGAVSSITNGDTFQGSWNVTNNKLYINWNNNTYHEFSYFIQGNRGSREALMTPPGGTQILWSESR